jgi:hypothetical protein
MIVHKFFKSSTSKDRLASEDELEKMLNLRNVWQQGLFGCGFSWDCIQSKSHIGTEKLGRFQYIVERLERFRPSEQNTEDTSILPEEDRKTLTKRTRCRFRMLDDINDINKLGRAGDVVVSVELSRVGALEMKQDREGLKVLRVSMIRNKLRMNATRRSRLNRFMYCEGLQI